MPKERKNSDFIVQSRTATTVNGNNGRIRKKRMKKSLYFLTTYDRSPNAIVRTHRSLIIIKLKFLAHTKPLLNSLEMKNKVGIDMHTANAIVPSDEEDGNNRTFNASNQVSSGKKDGSTSASEPAKEPNEMDAVVQLLGENVKIVMQKATAWLERTSESITIPIDKADSVDLHAHNFKMPLFSTYVASFIVAFIIIFVNSYISATTTQFLAPRGPESPPDLGCTSERNIISGTYRFDLVRHKI